MSNYYEILGISKESSLSEIKSAYRKAALLYHPDKNPDDLQAQALFIQVNKAYDTLSDPHKRNSYDVLLERGVSNTYQQQTTQPRKTYYQQQQTYRRKTNTNYKRPPSTKEPAYFETVFLGIAWVISCSVIISSFLIFVDLFLPKNDVKDYIDSNSAIYDFNDASSYSPGEYATITTIKNETFIIPNEVSTQIPIHAPIIIEKSLLLGIPYKIMYQFNASTVSSKPGYSIFSYTPVLLIGILSVFWFARPAITKKYQSERSSTLRAVCLGVNIVVFCFIIMIWLVNHFGIN